MNILCSKYYEMITENFSEIVDSVIFYGSNIYNENSSDLDVCIIVNCYDEMIKEKIISETIKFHLNNKLKLDDEIPFSNKLIYTVTEINEILKNPPFYDNCKVVIHDIVKSEKFLSSKEMKQRLMLNILTTDHLTVGKSTRKYENMAFKIIVNVIMKYFNIKNNSEDEILNCMYTNKYTGSYGEMFLGYKKNYPQKDVYLSKKIHEILMSINVKRID